MRAGDRASRAIVKCTSSLVAMLAATAAAGTLVPAGFAQPGVQVIRGFSMEAAGNPPPTGWSPQTFSGVKPTRYVLVREGDRTVLRAEADASASGLAFRLDAPAAAASILRWRWKAERLPEGADTRQRTTDDAVARLYVSFRHPPERVSAAQRMMDDGLRLLFGDIPPHATLLYVWDNRASAGTIFPNPHTDRVRNIVVETGTAGLSRWLSYERDVVADYRTAFGEDPPPIVGVALMTDADTTNSRALASYGDITLSPR